MSAGLPKGLSMTSIRVGPPSRQCSSCPCKSASSRVQSAMSAHAPSTHTHTHRTRAHAHYPVHLTRLHTLHTLAASHATPGDFGTAGCVTRRAAHGGAAQPRIAEGCAFAAQQRQEVWPHAAVCHSPPHHTPSLLCFLASLQAAARRLTHSSWHALCCHLAAKGQQKEDALPGTCTVAWMMVTKRAATEGHWDVPLGAQPLGCATSEHIGG